MQVAEGWWADSRGGPGALTSHRLYQEHKKPSVPRFAACGARMPMGWMWTDGAPVDRCPDCVLVTEVPDRRKLAICAPSNLRRTDDDPRGVVLARLAAWDSAERASGFAAAQFLANWIGSGQPRSVRDRDSMAELDLRARDARRAYFEVLT